MSPYSGYSIITPKLTKYTIKDITLSKFEDIMRDEHYDEFVCCKCHNKVMPFGNWQKMLPRCTVVTVNKLGIKILDMHTWKCQSCVSGENLGNYVRNISSKEKKRQSKKTSETMKKKYQDFDYNYQVLKNLIKDDKDMLDKLDKCKTIEELRALNSEVWSNIIKYSWHEPTKRANRLDALHKASKKIARSVRKLWKDNEYIYKQMETRLGISREEITKRLQSKNIDNQLLSWSNLLKEWFFNCTNRDKVTYLYYATVDGRDDILKIGISSDPSKRKYVFGYDSGCSNYTIIRKFDNRYQCAYVEYLLRVNYCLEKTEFIHVGDLNRVIRYSKKVHYNDSIHRDLKRLGWKF